MADREKVIDGLIGAIGLIHGYIPKRIWSESYGEQACRDAIALLKEHEAVKPYIAGSGESFETTWWYECGNCNKPIDPNDKFCRHCGRAVKWE